MTLSVCILACKDLSLNMRTIRQARSLAAAGHDVTIVAYKTPDPRLAGEGTAATLIATGSPPLPLMLLGRLWLTGSLLRSKRWRRRHADAGVAAGQSRSGLFAELAARSVAGRSFDIVQAHFDKALIAAARLAERCEAKLVFDAVEVPFDGELIPKNPTERALRLAEIERETEIARRADAWITVNDSIADHIRERFRLARPLVLRNFPDAGYRESDGRLRRDLGLGGDVRIVLHLNTMRPGEGLETAIDALAQLPADFHLVALGPVGQKAYVRKLRRQAGRLGVGGRLHFAPLQPPSDVLPYIAGADLGVITREGELQNLRLSLPNRLFQMIAARLPVVVTPLREIARIVRERQIGLVFEEGDAAGMAAAIRKLAEPAAAARYRGAIDRAADALTWEAESLQYVRFIERLAARMPAESRSTSPHLERMAGE